ncbi:MAG: hypothetical protein OEL75_04060, partial [Kiritimatiellaceae bacterium]|nr:hypothetical protein [Kiritimatiellaceae bacterium]
MRTCVIILILFYACFYSQANDTGFARYQIIIDKRPFGEEPPDEAETVQVPLNESFARNLRLSMLFEGAGGDLRVGFIDSSQKGKSYSLKVGESDDGIELVDIDINADEALLKKGNEVVLFKLKAAPEPLTPSKQASRNKSRSKTYADRRKEALNKRAA